MLKGYIKNFIIKICNYFFLFILYIFEQKVFSLPIGFGRTQGSLKYLELKSKNFYIYFEDTTINESIFTLNVLNNAKPVVEKWFGVSRKKPLPVIISSTTSNASFANFITDAIELQTLGQGHRDLIFHEYVHSTMYRHFDNILGPAGSALHLLWLPTWWIEGIAESLSQSIGSDLIAGIERYQATHNDWPSFNRLHNLYDGSDFTLRGYAVSSRFVTYILKKQSDPNFLYNVHKDFFYESCPWYWPYAILPLKNTMPFDKVLIKYFNKNSSELYEEYKNYATKLWKIQHDKIVFLQPNTYYQSFSFPYSIKIKGSKIFKLSYTNYQYYESELIFDGSWAKNIKLLTQIPFTLEHSPRITNSSVNALVFTNKNFEWEDGNNIVFYSSNFKQVLNKFYRKANISRLLESPYHIIWQENFKNTTRVCLVAKEKIYSKKININDITCYFENIFPQTTQIIGEQYDEKGLSSLIILKITNQTLIQDQHELVLWQPDTNNFYNLNYKFKSHPIAAGISKNYIWVLAAEQYYRHIKKLDFNGVCLGKIKLWDTPLNLFATYNDELIMPIFAGEKYPIVKFIPQDNMLTKCDDKESYPTSPIIYALKENTSMSFIDAINSLDKIDFENIDNQHIPNNEKLSTNINSNIQDKQSLVEIKNNTSEDKNINTNEAYEYKWKSRHILTIPWIGEDALGYQLGIVSVPLMDHLQNETLRAYIAIGLESKFPHYELSLTSSRFWPELKIDAFRYQTWNGYYWDENKNKKNAYFDERGIRFSASYYLFKINTSLSLGIKSSKLINYIGYTSQPDKYLNETFIYLTHSNNINPYFWNFSILGKIAPSYLNKDYEYNSSYFATNLGRNFDLLTSSLSLNLEAALTRGKKRMRVEQVYRPLRVYIPEGSSSFNNVFFPFYGEGYLFDALFGNNLLKASFNWTFPIITNLDKLIKILYLETLYFSAIYSYGSAWYGTFNPQKAYFIKSHTYNLNLKSNVKGIKLNFGLGTGQVYQKSFDIYGSFNFEALF